MKRFKLFFGIIISVLSFNQLVAQSYVPFPDSNCVWSVGVKKFLIKGDSLINTFTYKKYYVTADSNLSPGTLYFKGLIRQNKAQKKIYGIAPGDTIEKLLYDFNLNLNDWVSVYSVIPYSSSNGPYTLQVTMKDSLLINNQYRKRLFLRKNVYSQGEFWIEGIGSYFGPLQVGVSYGIMWGTDDWRPPCIPTLLCQKTGSVSTYINPLYNTCFKYTAYVYNCTQPVGLVKESLKNSLSISPNPSNESVKIKIDLPGDKTYVVKIQDVYGRELYHQLIEEETNSNLSISDYLPGIYFVSIIYQGKSLDTKKLIIVH